VTNERDNFTEIPKEWVWTTIGEIFEPSKERVDPLEVQEIPYISLEHIEKDTGKLLGHGLSTEVRSTVIEILDEILAEENQNDSH
jgi:hypothetical protein